MTTAPRRLRAPRSLRRVDALLEDVNRQVRRLADGKARDMARLIRETRDELAEETRAWMRRQGFDGATRWTYWHQRQAQLKLETALEALEPKVLRELTTGSGDAARLSIDHARQEVATLSRMFGEPTTLDLDTAQPVMDTRRGLVPRHRSSAERYIWGPARGATPSAWTDITRELTRGVLAQRTWGEIGGRVAERVGVQGYVGERLARTEMIHAYNEQSMVVAAREGYLLEWNAALYRTCPRCRAVDGEKRKPGETFADGVTHPPLHPNCRCSALLTREEWF